MTSMDRVQIAGVAWPRYKLVALVLGFMVFAVVGIVTMSVASAVLLGAATATVVWLALGLRRRH